MTGDYYVISRRKGDRSKDTNKYLNDAKILEEALASGEDADLRGRYLFYLAQSYASASESDKSARAYLITQQRFKLAQYYLYLYQAARCVVTHRLHATLPCLAFGTPVVNIELPNFEPNRFAGLRELAHHYTVEEFLTQEDFDINNPPANPGRHLEIRAKLEEQCQAYTGFKSDKGFLDGRDLLDFLQGSGYHPVPINRSCCSF